jgi:hypothetical protein
MLVTQEEAVRGAGSEGGAGEKHLIPARVLAVGSFPEGCVGIGEQWEQADAVGAQLDARDVPRGTRLGLKTNG